ncbi:DUF485 domain-containing protein [Methylobacterium oryzisoli]|uniref:DUF485 domain-containing protein n=1 Tax=Methylobacterium oryzisoli TaxID=3385502 RepID=UPI003891F234
MESTRDGTGALRSEPNDLEALRWWLSALVAFAYGGFLLASYALGPALARPVLGSVPWSFLLGAGLLVVVVAVMGVYVLVVNGREAA